MTVMPFCQLKVTPCQAISIDFEIPIDYVSSFNKNIPYWWNIHHSFRPNQNPKTPKPQNPVSLEEKRDKNSGTWNWIQKDELSDVGVLSHMESNDSICPTVKDRDIIRKFKQHEYRAICSPSKTRWRRQSNL